VPHLKEGRLYDAYAERTAQPVVVIGDGMAERLGITTLATRPALFIGDRPFTVIGIVDDVRRNADLLLSVV
ncbi:ABC transporter permease, partial [Streptomyces sp. SID11233]|nr:ABC transporter permease [Streptomyces sp. SID11233]